MTLAVKRAMAPRVHDVETGRDHADREPARVERAQMSRGVDSDREPAHDGDPGAGQERRRARARRPARAASRIRVPTIATRPPRTRRAARLRPGAPAAGRGAGRGSGSRRRRRSRPGWRALRIARAPRSDDASSLHRRASSRGSSSSHRPMRWVTRRGAHGFERGDGTAERVEHPAQARRRDEKEGGEGRRRDRTFVETHQTSSRSKAARMTSSAVTIS